MKLWTTEYGTLWVLQPGKELPPPCEAKLAVSFAEASLANVDELTQAMNRDDPVEIRLRLQNGRRCFLWRTGGQQIVSYGWVTQGKELVGELERQFNLCPDEAYIWDCGTRPEWRGQRLYSALLSQIVYRLHEESVPRIWIGASRLNQPSIQGFANAGFQHVVDVTYRRFWRLTLLWIHQAQSEKRPLTSAAYRILINDHERRYGRLAIGFLGDTDEHG
jgi:GNAT superfamily N-acetyltransferase